MNSHSTLFAHAVAAAPLDIRRSARFGEAFEAISRNCLAQVRGNVPGVLAGDVESLHQMRVGVRRLRALLSATESWDPMPEGTAGKLRWFGMELGLARNWDVFLESTLPGLGGSSQPVEAMARELTAKQHAHVRHLLQGSRCKALFDELELWSGERLWRERHAYSLGTRMRAKWRARCCGRRANGSGSACASSMPRNPAACTGCASL